MLSLYVSNFSHKTTEEDLAAFFLQQGFPPTEVSIVRRKAGVPLDRPFAFLKFGHDDGTIIAAAIAKMHDSLYGVRRLIVRQGRKG